MTTDPAMANRPPTDGGVGDGEKADQRLAQDMRKFVAGLRGAAAAQGISAATLERALAGIEPDTSIPPLLVRQPEHVMAPWEYMARLVSDVRIAEGRRMLAHHRATLDDIEARLGVDRHVVVAIWGIESNYGTLPGTRSVVRSLATLAVADQRRPDFWRSELLKALAILERGDIAFDAMTGSWAGAMGHTQFMPSSYLAHAFDLDGDGRRDIWQSVPDALASTANYLKNAGWRTGEAAAVEVIIPAGFDYAEADPDIVRPGAEWQARGLSNPAGHTWPGGTGQSSLLLPAGMHGPAFLTGANFKAILRYNNATAYALAVAHLANRIAGGPALAALWPVDDPPIGIAERRELQTLLNALGHSVGQVDGIIGEGTRTAVRSWQKTRGLAADGWTGERLLGLLRTVAARDDD